MHIKPNGLLLYFLLFFWCNNEIEVELLCVDVDHVRNEVRYLLVVKCILYIRLRSEKLSLGNCLSSEIVSVSFQIVLSIQFFLIKILLETSLFFLFQKCVCSPLNLLPPIIITYFNLCF